MDTKLRITVSAYKDEDMGKDFKPEGYYVHSEYVIGQDYQKTEYDARKQSYIMIKDVVTAVKHARKVNSGIK